MIKSGKLMSQDSLIILDNGQMNGLATISSPFPSHSVGRDWWEPGISNNPSGRVNDKLRYEIMKRISKSYSTKYWLLWLIISAHERYVRMLVWLIEVHIGFTSYQYYKYEYNMCSNICWTNLACERLWTYNAEYHDW